MIVFQPTSLAMIGVAAMIRLTAQRSTTSSFENALLISSLFSPFAVMVLPSSSSSTRHPVRLPIISRNRLLNVNPAGPVCRLGILVLQVRVNVSCGINEFSTTSVSSINPESSCCASSIGNCSPWAASGSVWVSAFLLTLTS